VRGWVGSLVLVPLVAVLWGSPLELGVRIDARWLLPPLFGAWLGLRAWAGSSSFAAPLARRLLAAWRRLDPLVAASLIYALLFRPPESLLLPLMIWLAIAGVVALFDRASGPVLVSLLTALLVFGVAVPRGFRAILVSKIASTYQTDVDHRLKPDGGQINSDGVRFRGESGDLGDEDFVVLFLGDSFTFGFNLPYASTYPQQFEGAARAAACEPRVRVVNFGWVSSSPLLSLRLLREVGYRYQPDLVVYNLDMTDFHDDLRYEIALRGVGELDFDSAAVLSRLLILHAPWAKGALPVLAAITERLRSEADDGRSRSFSQLRFPGPKERRFTTSYPLARSRPAIELGVMKNLAEMHDLVSGALAGEMALVVYPRHYQLVRQPRSQPMGRYVREPFRYFEEVAGELPYSVISLLEDFEQSPTWPLFFEHDPHWNKQGAVLAARSVLRELRARGLIRCPES